MSVPAQRPPARPRTRGPVLFTLMVAMSLFFTAVMAWMVGLLIEIAGDYLFWPGRADGHALEIVQEDMAYIAAAPRSVLAGDTVAFSQQVLAGVRWPFERAGVRWPFERAGVLRAWARWRDIQAQAQDNAQHGLPAGMTRVTQGLLRTLGRWAVIAMLVAQDVILRLLVAFFALPAFALACLLGLLDGLVRRDLRRWSGGRESSFIYHHAKRYTLWSLTGGFGLYLSWPLGGFNPACMVLVFTVLVAASLSTTVGAFKKYL